jgi:Arm DNA-binding domain
MARKTLTDRGVAALKPRSKLYAHADPQMPGHYVRVTPAGAKSFAVMARDPSGRQVLATIGSAAHLTIDAARLKARGTIAAINAGTDRAGPQSFQAVAAEWFKRQVTAKALHSAEAIRRSLDNHILPTWGGREFTSIKRGDVAKLLDKIEDKAGPVAADFALSVIQRICNWHASRHDDYASPIVKGMRRSSSKERARSRILNDAEVKAIWEAADGTFGGATP